MEDSATIKAVAIHHYEFGPDYLEFYLLEHSALDKIYFAWPQEAVTHNLLILEGAIGIRTYPDLNVTVNVTVEIRDTAPSDDRGGAQWQRINECSLNVSSEALTLSFWGWDHTSGDIQITPDCYRARVYYGNQSELDAKFLTSGTPVRGQDSYKIILWPAEYEELVVIQAAPLAQAPKPTPPEFCHLMSQGSLSKS